MVFMPAIRSSTIASADYDGARQKLTISFKNGGVYDYSGVDAKTYNDFLEAPSQGTFFANYIRGKYPTEKIK